ncbi:putative fliT domain protein [Candidatus Competibacter denitrificans Run_A_D11]|uniref:Flagellar protein FliT n=1 Tax=Candidatus Competibacter denitrificans Run_A_D11 TaxID=1400863 RepID=W6M9K5_9GAMM|nr:flagellar protein FliT [Candidatus Competibacter denitrificans]CDI03299.1 putative fliT domain protein [Candidatus Competibacter denitrificans Run_A_D11]HAS85206.1 flagellar protein FliT [Candidatus Competibacteraceae bacterium]HRC68912.1 flagellar protein FliT [Candidatus Competibacter denitrificans]
MIETPNDWEQAITLLRLLSVEMVELAEAGGWDEVTTWEDKRRALLDEMFQKKPPAAFATALAETVRTVLANDARLKALASLEMSKLAGYLKSFDQGRRARNAYQTL